MRRDKFDVPVLSLINLQAGETALAMAERRARCGASERADGERASTWGGIASLLGGSGSTKNLKEKGYYNGA